MTTKAIDIEWLPFNIKITADLDAEDQNPVLANLLWTHLPYNSLQNHALVSGHHLYHIAPIPELVYKKAQIKEDRTKSPDGTVFLSGLRHMAIKYGPLTEYIPAAPVGHVREADLPSYRKVGRLSWEAATKSHIAVEVRVTRHNEEYTGFQLPEPPKVTSKNVQKLMHKIRSLTQDMWIDKPTELVNIHEGNIRSKAGSYNQYFTTMIFVNGETRPLGYNAIDGLIRLSRENSTTLEQLQVTAPHFISIPGEFLGYCGLDTMWDFIQETMEVLGELKTKDEFMVLMEVLGLYVNVLNSWNLQLFPWDVTGDTFVYRNGKSGSVQKVKEG